MRKGKAMTAPAHVEQTGPTTAARSRRRWLLFVHQLPSHPSNLRVRTWRRLQQLGAQPVKQAVYVLPDTPGAREDFEWLKAEVKAAGGDASVFAAISVDAWDDDALVEAFRHARQADYTALARELERALKQAGSPRRARGTRAPVVRRRLDLFGERLAALDAIDFFGSAGRDRVVRLLGELHDRAAGRPRTSPSSGASGDAPSYKARLWVTRPRPGVDRMASAWLIHRFIDPAARFGFAADRQAVPDGGVPFDMFDVDFSHRGDGCTFETLCAVFGLDAPALSRIAAIVHDLDLKDGRFGAPEATTVGSLIDGLQLANPDDDALLGQGMTLFESLYRSFERSLRAAGPRAVARPARQASRPGKTRRARKTR
jgi:hypothetical protein